MWGRRLGFGVVAHDHFVGVEEDLLYGVSSRYHDAAGEVDSVDSFLQCYWSVQVEPDVAAVAFSCCYQTKLALVYDQGIGK